VGIEVRHGSHVGGDIIVTKEGYHMTVVYQMSCDDKEELSHDRCVVRGHVITKQESKLVPKCREK